MTILSSRGSKRTGPDLAREGGKYPNSWHVEHLTTHAPSCRELSMPNYAFLARNYLQTWDLKDKMRVLRLEGVPYSDDQISKLQDVQIQTLPNEDPSGLQQRYGAKVVCRRITAVTIPARRPRWTRSSPISSSWAPR